MFPLQPARKIAVFDTTQSTVSRPKNKTVLTFGLACAILVFGMCALAVK